MNDQEPLSYRPAVQRVQTYLYTIATVDPEIPRVNPDGIYGPTTAESVTAFQNKYRLPPNGKVNFETWQMLLLRYHEALRALGEPTRISPFRLFLKNGVLIPGDRSDLVMLLRIMLGQLGLIYLPLEGFPVSDRYDDDLSYAVTHFQLTQGLPDTGIVDRGTWDRLALAYNETARING